MNSENKKKRGFLFFRNDEEVNEQEREEYWEAYTSLKSTVRELNDPNGSLAEVHTHQRRQALIELANKALAHAGDIHYRYPKNQSSLIPALRAANAAIRDPSPENRAELLSTASSLSRGRKIAVGVSFALVALEIALYMTLIILGTLFTLGAAAPILTAVIVLSFFVQGVAFVPVHAITVASLFRQGKLADDLNEIADNLPQPTAPTTETESEHQPAFGLAY